MTPSVRRPSSVPGGLQWYAVKVHSGREEAVKEVLQRRVRGEALDDVVGRLLVPVEKVAEMRRGRRVERTRKLFPGYMLCELVLDDRVLALFREVPGVSDFLGSGSTPVPLSPAEAERLVGGQEEGKVKVILPAFDPGDRVRVLRGTFAVMEGEVAAVLADTGRVRVRLEIIGRPEHLDLEASEILQLAGPCMTAAGRGGKAGARTAAGHLVCAGNSTGGGCLSAPFTGLAAQRCRPAVDGG